MCEHVPCRPCASLAAHAPAVHTHPGRSQQVDLARGLFLSPQVVDTASTKFEWRVPDFDGLRCGSSAVARRAARGRLGVGQG